MNLNRRSHRQTNWYYSNFLNFVVLHVYSWVLHWVWIAMTCHVWVDSSSKQCGSSTQIYLPIYQQIKPTVELTLMLCEYLDLTLSKLVFYVCIKACKKLASGALMWVRWQGKWQLWKIEFLFEDFDIQKVLDSLSFILDDIFYPKAIPEIIKYILLLKWHMFFVHFPKIYCFTCIDNSYTPTALSQRHHHSI